MPRVCQTPLRRELLLALALMSVTAPVSARVFETVEVRGAQFIPAEDIRMTCGAMPNIDYASYELRAIEDCLMLTGVFEAVSLYPEGDALIIDVAEIDDRPGRIEAALSYVSDHGVVGELSFEQYNLFPGTYGALNLSFNSEVKSLEAHLYRADAFNETLDFGVDLFALESDLDDTGYSEQGVRAEPYLAWTPYDHARLEMGIGWRSYRMYDVDASASALLFKEETDEISAPYLRISAVYSGGGEQQDVPDGVESLEYGLRLDQYLWNIGSEDVLSDSRLEANLIQPFGEGYRFLGTLRAGSVTGLSGNDTRAIDRFFPGADTFRGFAPRGIGPRDGGGSLGGNHYLVGSIEVQRDIGHVLSMPMQAGLFVEAGSSWGLDDTLSGRIDDSWHSRVSTGLSLTFEVANTPVSLYVATPLRKFAGDTTQTFGLSFTTRF
ncbi:outer membrane protein assembly factor BamA [Antarctobacter heliothermus]|uniref:Outer membrane protein assembly factor BamA n=1 Tax=Antarctobacter heliothermus TaxID=74033 RepID=A0A222E1R0_9RHOB|nr:BamA/TamA family outer membrane protein [Antarctobacter heliothermus]ASP19908.1 outer membrane protein assembly factor BamA [Antarctobacter heliothermus]